MYSLKSSNVYAAATPLPSVNGIANHSQPAWVISYKQSVDSSAAPTDVAVNKLLAALPPEEMGRLLPELEMVSLARGEDVRGAQDGDGFVHFPQSAVISHLTVLKDGGTTEVALIGNEGLVGLSVIFDTQAPEQWARVAIPGSTLRVRAATLKREFERGGTLQRLLLRYTGSYVEQVAQRAVCNSQHKIEERFAAWLLMMHDRVGGDLLPLTHEQIARRLGTRRSSVTLAAVALQERGIINYLRGRIRVLDRPALERAACECYGAISHTARQAVNLKLRKIDKSG